jgi:hypothetical protein
MPQSDPGQIPSPAAPIPKGQLLSPLESDEHSRAAFQWTGPIHLTSFVAATMLILLAARLPNVIQQGRSIEKLILLMYRVQLFAGYHQSLVIEDMLDANPQEVFGQAGRGTLEEGLGILESSCLVDFVHILPMAWNGMD